MLDSLDINQTIKIRSSQNTQSTKEERFNNLFLKLKERNIHNDIFIKKYVRKISKRHDQINAANENNHFDQLRVQLDLIENEDRINEGDNMIQKLSILSIQSALNHYSHDDQLVGQDCKLQKTNDTLHSESNDEHIKVNSFPIIDSQPGMTYQRDQSAQIKNKTNFTLPKHHIEFTNYLKNVFFKQAIDRGQQKKKMKPSSQIQFPRNSYQGRLHTDNDMPSKYQLSIKSLVFGSQQIVLNKKIVIQQEKIKRNGRVATDTNQRLTSQEKGGVTPFEDKQIVCKGMLPSINQIQVQRNRLCMQNFLKMNQDRPKQKTRLMKLVKLSQQNSMTSETENANRIGLSFRINTIQIKRHF